MFIFPKTLRLEHSQSQLALELKELMLSDGNKTNLSPRLNDKFYKKIVLHDWPTIGSFDGTQALM
jgi:hypothetical protein